MRRGVGDGMPRCKMTVVEAVVMEVDEDFLIECNRILDAMMTVMIQVTLSDLKRLQDLC